MSAHILTWLGAAYGLLYRQRIYSSIIASWGARVLIAASVVAIIGGSMLALNPVLDGSVLQGGAVFNTLLLAYLAPAGLLWLIARSLLLINMDRLRPHVEGLAVVLVTTFVSLEIKRLYNGPFLSIEPADEVEQALLIIAWLGLACGLVYRSNILSPLATLWSGRGLTVDFGGCNRVGVAICVQPHCEGTAAARQCPVQCAAAGLHRTSCVARPHRPET